MEVIFEHTSHEYPDKKRVLLMWFWLTTLFILLVIGMAIEQVELKRVGATSSSTSTFCLHYGLFNYWRCDYDKDNKYPVDRWMNLNTLFPLPEECRPYKEHMQAASAFAVFSVLGVFANWVVVFAIDLQRKRGSPKSYVSSILNFIIWVFVLIAWLVVHAFYSKPLCTNNPFSLEDLGATLVAGFGLFVFAWASHTIVMLVYFVFHCQTNPELEGGGEAAAANTRVNDPTASAGHHHHHHPHQHHSQHPHNNSSHHHDPHQRQRNSRQRHTPVNDDTSEDPWGQLNAMQPAPTPPRHPPPPPDNGDRQRHGAHMPPPPSYEGAMKQPAPLPPQGTPTGGVWGGVGGKRSSSRDVTMVAPRSANRCAVCFQSRRTHVILPCGHLELCAPCHDRRSSTSGGGRRGGLCTRCFCEVTSVVEITVIDTSINPDQCMQCHQGGQTTHMLSTCGHRALCASCANRSSLACPKCGATSPCAVEVETS